MTRDRILQYVAEHNAKHGYSPTIREIADAVNIKSSSTVHGHLNRMEKAGFIERKQHSPRSIRVVNAINEDKVNVIKYKKEIPTVIVWQNRRYVLDMVR